MVQLLLQAGASPLVTNNVDHTPRSTCGHEIEPGVSEALARAEQAAGAA